MTTTEISGRLDVQLVTRRRIHFNREDATFQLALLGRSDGIRTLFSRRAAWPNDIQSTNGWTALHYTIQHKRFDACRLLLNVGADPEIENDAGLSAVQFAWTKIFSSPAGDPTMEKLRLLFPDAEDQALSFDFSPAHRIVLGLQPDAPLETFLRHDGLPSEGRQRRRSLDLADSFGQTPLWWAARRGEVENVQALLIAGADPNRKNASGNGPLYAAAQSRSARSIELLLLAGADAAARNIWGYQAVHAAAMCCDDPACLEPFFVTAEVAVDTKTPDGDTPLQRCARYDNARSGAYLLGVGADINNVNGQGETPLMETVLRGNHAMMRLLLRHTGRLDLGAANRHGCTIFHLIALSASLATLAVLEEDCDWGTAATRQVDLSRRDGKGRTVLDALKDRVLDREGDADGDKFREAFVRLMCKIEDDIASHSSLDLYFDAQVDLDLAEMGQLTS